MPSPTDNALSPYAGIDMRGSSTGDAALALKYQPLWQQAYINGQTDKQFQEWLPEFLGQQQQQQSQPQQSQPARAGLLGSLTNLLRR